MCLRMEILRDPAFFGPHVQPARAPSLAGNNPRPLLGCPGRCTYDPWGEGGVVVVTHPSGGPPHAFRSQPAGPGGAPHRGVLCHLIASNFFGGPEKQILESSTRLPGLGWSVVVGSFRERRPEVDIIESAKTRGITTFLIETASPYDPSAMWKLRRFLARLRVDVLITHGYKSNLIGYLATRRSAVVQLPMVRGYTGEDWKVRAYEVVDRCLLRRSQHVLCVSEGTRRKLIRFGLDGQRISVVPNAVDCDLQVTPADLSKEFSIPKEARSIVAAGRLSPEKGHGYLVDAMRQLKALVPPVHLIILGAGKEQPSLERQIRESQLADRVVLGGFREDVLGCIAAADLVVNPSLTEGLPNVVLEALALKTPVVATDVGGVGELVIHGQTGWLVAPADPGALAAAMVQALADRDHARRMAENGFRLVVSSFSFSSQAQRLAEVCTDRLTQSRNATPQR
jgi:glycosyltransferase involved in cell wall biosynthesis